MAACGNVVTGHLCQAGPIAGPADRLTLPGAPDSRLLAGPAGAGTVLGATDTETGGVPFGAVIVPIGDLLPASRFANAIDLGDDVAHATTIAKPHSDADQLWYSDWFASRLTAGRPGREYWRRDVAFGTVEYALLELDVRPQRDRRQQDGRHRNRRGRGGGMR